MGNVLIFKQILLTNSLRKCMEISLENLYLDIEALRVNRISENCGIKQLTMAVNKCHKAGFTQEESFPDS